MIYNEKSQKKEKTNKKHFRWVFSCLGFLGWVFGANPDPQPWSKCIIYTPVRIHNTALIIQEQEQEEEDDDIILVEEILPEPVPIFKPS